MTLREWLTMAGKELAAAGIAEADSDAWILLAHETGISRMTYSLDSHRRLETAQADRLNRDLLLRKQHIPVQQITGEAWFMGYVFEVNEHVLIPRLDTEVLVEAVLSRSQDVPVAPDGKKRVLDMCTGSGCILLTLLKENEEFCGTGVDISPEALAVAKRNARRLEAEADFVHSDLWEKVTGTYQVIVSNPPYIVHDVVETLETEVKDHEPMLALDGGEDGLSFYRRIVARAGEYLAEGGLLAFEIGYDQGEALRQMLDSAGYRKIEILKDLAGLDRVALGWKYR